MKNHEVRTHKSAEDFPYEEHLAYKVAEVAADPVEVPAETTDMIINRIIDNAAVGTASVARGPVTSARVMAQAHPVTKGGSTVFGVDGTYSAEWAALANGTAVRELDYHDTFLAAEYSHPGDNIPPLLATAQHKGLSGRDLIRGIATGYEIQVNLVKGMCLHEHKIDVPDDDTLARPEFMQSRKVLELQRELEVHKRTAELNALDLQRAQEQLHHMSQEWEVRRLQGASSRQELETLRLRAEQAERQLIEATEAHDQRTSQLENDYLTAVQFVRNTENMLRRLKDEHNKLRHDNAELRVLAAGQSPHAPLSSTRTFRSP